ncbi:MAG: type I-E CRISPR-associated protein Cas5/CasD [Planctomycetia bacterium]|nr:type I-E CRISPR-associated protein Cas5/CasD [Planctomycetia bacterium]
MKYLLLWLEAPLQSWGYDSRFDVRQTFNFPTMSGVYGILLASSGDSGAQCELLARMKNADFTAISFLPKPAENQEATLQERAKRLENHVENSRLRDYHMVGSGYDDKDPWEKLHIPRTPKGTIAVANEGYGGTKQTYRYYLQDKKFAVVLGLEDDLAEKFAKSLQEPVYDLYLGRKCCVPTDLIYRGIFPNKEEAENEMKTVAKTKKLEPFQQFVTAEQDRFTEEDAFFISDVPVQFGETKRYMDRCVKIVDWV